jgi:hypothetical protein
MKTRSKMPAMLFTVVLLFGMSASSVLAEDGKDQLSAWKFDEIRMSVSLPDSWYVFTTDNIKANPNFEYVSSDEKLMLKLFKKNNLVFNAIASDLNCEISCAASHSLKSNRINNFNSLSSEELKAQAESLVDYDFVSKKSNLDYNAYKIVTVNGLTYICLQGQLLSSEDYETVSANFLQYSTIVNGDYVQFEFYRYDGDITDEDRLLMSSVIDSIQFDEIEADSSIDTDILLKIIAIVAVIVLLIGSVIWHLVYYRKSKRN